MIKKSFIQTASYTYTDTYTIQYRDTCTHNTRMHKHNSHKATHTWLFAQYRAHTHTRKHTHAHVHPPAASVYIYLHFSWDFKRKWMTMKFIIDEPGPDRPFINCNNQVAPHPLSLLPPSLFPPPSQCLAQKGRFFVWFAVVIYQSN